VLILAIVSLSVPLALRFSARVNDEVRTQARAQINLVEATAAQLMTPLTTASQRQLRGLVRSYGVSVAGRVTVVDRNGLVLADGDPAQIGQRYATARRPEFGYALRGGVYQAERTSRTLAAQHRASRLLVTAVPIRGGRSGRAVVGAVRITQAVSSIHDAVRQTILVVVVIGLVVLALGLSAGALVATQIAMPLRRLERVARRIAGGETTARAALEGSSEQRSLGESFNEMTDRIVRLLDAQRDFVADASHQLRTPLTGLRLRIEEARASGVSADAMRELAAAETEVERLAQIIDELLVLSGAGERELPGERVQLADVARRALERWRAIADGREIDLQLASSSRDAVVWGARADVDRAVDALLENAVRYSPEASTVTIVVEPSAISILDGGPGIAQDESTLVFERFRRGRAGRASGGGTGLGLAIARELAHAWGGQVTLKNRPEGGAAATLRLPEPP
jgi:signal transduction histidine kinase